MCYRVCKYFCNFVVSCLPFRFCSAAWQQTPLALCYRLAAEDIGAGVKLNVA